MRLLLISLLCAGCAVPFSHSADLDVRIPLHFESRCTIDTGDETDVYVHAELDDGQCTLWATWSYPLADTAELQRSIEDEVTGAGFSAERIRRVDFLSLDLILQEVSFQEAGGGPATFPVPVDVWSRVRFDYSDWDELGAEQLRGFEPPPLLTLSQYDLSSSELDPGTFNALSLGPIEVKGEDTTLYALDQLYAQGLPFGTLGELKVSAYEEDLPALDGWAPVVVVRGTVELTGQMWVR